MSKSMNIETIEYLIIKNLEGAGLPAEWVNCQILKIKDRHQKISSECIQQFSTKKLLDNIRDIFVILFRKTDDIYPNYMEIDMKWDFLGTFYQNGHPLLEANLEVMSWIRPRRNLAVVATVRNEGPFLLDWISHHLAVGVEHFYIYFNDNTDGSDILLEKLSNFDCITIIKSFVSKSVNPQIKAYDHSVHFMSNIRDFKWVTFIDADEFIVPSQAFEGNAVKMLGEAERQDFSKSPASLSLNWIWMGSSDNLQAELDRSVISRFKVGKPHLYVRSFVKLEAVKSMLSVHKPILQETSIGLDGCFNIANMDGHELDIALDAGCILHFWNKSFEEFLVKQSRGFDRAVWQRDTSLFFEWDTKLTGSEFDLFPEMAVNTERYKNKLIGLFQIEDVEYEIKIMYKKLARKCIGSMNIKDIYDDAMAHYEIKGSLKSID